MGNLTALRPTKPCKQWRHVKQEMRRTFSDLDADSHEQQ
jgi:hypothetical protein